MSRSDKLLDDQQETCGDESEAESLRRDRHPGTHPAVPSTEEPRAERDRGTHRNIAGLQAEIQPEQTVEPCCGTEVAQLERFERGASDGGDHHSPGEALHREVKDER